MIPGHDLLCQVQHLLGGLRIQRRRVLIQQQHLRLLQSGHQQGHRLALTAAEQTYFGGQAGVQPQIQLFEHLRILRLFFFTDAGTQGSPLATAGGDGQILGDLHIRSRAGHGVLEHTADKLGALVFRQLGHILAVDHNRTAVHRIHTGDHIQHSGFAGAVAADHRYKIALVQGQINAAKGLFLIDGAGVKCLLYTCDFKHCPCPPYSSLHAWRSAALSSTARPGTAPPPKRRTASGRWRSGPFAAPTE